MIEDWNDIKKAACRPEVVMLEVFCVLVQDRVDVINCRGQKDAADCQKIDARPDSSKVKSSFVTISLLFLRSTSAILMKTTIEQTMLTS